jgi:carbonic anhydrase
MIRTLTAMPVRTLVSLVAVAAGVTSLPALATDWRMVISGKTEVIEIDRDRIVEASGGILGWSRIRLSRSVNDPSGMYNAIYAQNLYDCDARRFTTMQRAYFNGPTLVREEAVTRQRANAIMPGSIDERLMNEACRKLQPDVAMLDTGDVSAVADSGGQGGALRADMRTLADKGAPRMLQVADAHAADPHAAEKPKRIEIPAIDKAAADAAAAAAGTKAAAPAAPAPHGAPAAAMPAKPAAPAPAAAGAHGAAPVVKMPAPADPHESPMEKAEKRARELQMATSGPAKKKAKKSNPAHDMHAHWGYEGETGPVNWAKLEAANAVCGSGKRQSPIDIREGIKVDLSPVKFDYIPSLFQVVDNGHTIQVNLDEGQSITVLGRRYDLIQFHFHKPSEERVNGRSYDMVAHLVHRDEDGRLAVIAVLLERGLEHPVIQTVWNHLPLEKKSQTVSEMTVNLMNLIPEKRAYWTYMGSLTTPPCSENVLWMVMKSPVQISPEQVQIFSRLYKNNARPVQPSNGRLVKESR